MGEQNITQHTFLEKTLCLIYHKERSVKTIKVSYNNLYVFTDDTLIMFRDTIQGVPYPYLVLFNPVFVCSFNVRFFLLVRRL